VPAFLQLAHIRYINQAAYADHLSYLRRLKVFAMIGSFGAVWWEKTQLEKKWDYYDKFYPEATQL
tara:strand:- start:298 stop:492 length:195 start_codon:yes stop_codon:yes gene_type:complete